MERLHWKTVSERGYAAVTCEGSVIELQADPDNDGWYLFSPLPEHAGIDYLGDDLHSAMHLTIAMMRPNHQVDGWTLDGQAQGNLVWGSTTAAEAEVPLDEEGPDDDPTGASWWGRFLRRSASPE